jgi:hypothetical protein
MPRKKENTNEPKKVKKTTKKIKKEKEPELTISEESMLLSEEEVAELISTIEEDSDQDIINLDDPKSMLKIAGRILYDYQKLRISTANRITSYFRRRLGQKPSQKLEESKVSDEKLDLLDLVQKEYKLIADGITSNKVKIEELIKKEKRTYINSLQEFKLIEPYIQLRKAEKNIEKSLIPYLESIPIYSRFLKNVKGCGPLMSMILISYLDVKKAKYVSSFWKYAGIDVVINKETGEGEGRSKKKDHLTQVKYIDKNGEEKEKDSITFNPTLRTKLLGVLAPCFIKARSPYKEHYDNSKFRYKNDPKHKDKTPKHIDRMATRIMIKLFLKDMYLVMCEVEGIEPQLDYAEAKYNLFHSGPFVYKKHNLFI